jgi:hypothetical protein
MKIIKATDLTGQPSDKIVETLHPWEINTNNYLGVGVLESIREVADFLRGRDTAGRVGLI